MKRAKATTAILLILAGAALPVTFGTCTRTEFGGSGFLVSSNDHLVGDVLDFLGGPEHEDDDD